MSILIQYTPWITATFFFLMALLMHTENIKSAIFFKVIPFTLGVVNLLVALNLSEII